MSGERKRWVKAGYTNGKTTVTVTLVEGNISAKWAEPTYPTEIKKGAVTANKQAVRMLTELQAVVDELGEP